MERGRVQFKFWSLHGHHETAAHKWFAAYADWSARELRIKRGGDIQYLWNGRGQTGPGVMVEPLHLVCASVSLCVFYSLWNEDGGKVMRGGSGMGSHDNQPPINPPNSHTRTHTCCLSWAWDNRVKGPWVLGVIGRGPGSQGTHGRDKEALDSIKHEQGWTYIRPHGKHHNSTPSSAQSTPSVTGERDIVTKRGK